MERLTGFNQRNWLSYIEGYAEYLPAEVQMQLIQAVVDKCRRYEDAEAEGRLLWLPRETVSGGKDCEKCNHPKSPLCKYCSNDAGANPAKKEKRKGGDVMVDL